MEKEFLVVMMSRWRGDIQCTNTIVHALDAVNCKSSMEHLTLMVQLCAADVIGPQMSEL